MIHLTVSTAVAPVATQAVSVKQKQTTAIQIHASTRAHAMLQTHFMVSTAAAPVATWEDL
jgi:hypothetical protein